jgi:hypothetical protein
VEALRGRQRRGKTGSMVRLRLALVVPALVGVACQPPDVPTPEDAAAYLGLAAGSVVAFDAAGSEAQLEVKQSSVLRDEALVFDLISKQQGFIQDDRTFTIAVGVQQTSIVRFADCIQRCGTPDADIPFVSVPLDTGDNAATDVNVSVVVNGAEEAVNVEKHTILVGDEVETTVPAGDFTGFNISWTRDRDGDAQTSLLVIAPEVGIVSWQTFDGASLKRK